MRVLLLRLEGPLMSFGDVKVDARNPTRDHPGLGQMTGLLGNALGYDHADADRLTRLQERLRVASRCEVTGTPLRDYQTVDLGQPFMQEGWTTRGQVEGRKGGTASDGTHIRQRHYHADRLQLVAVTLTPSDETPTLDEVAAALDAPARPLFLGRKACLPSGRLNAGIIESQSLHAALEKTPRDRRAASAFLSAWWPEDPVAPPPADSRVVAVVDERDWRGQVVVGRRLVRQGRVNPPLAQPEASDV
jgi:CRISPR system Cascade subunit CasD